MTNEYKIETKTGKCATADRLIDAAEFVLDNIAKPVWGPWVHAEDNRSEFCCITCNGELVARVDHAL